MVEPELARPATTRAAAPIALAGVAFWCTNALAGSTALAGSSLLQVITAQFVGATVTLLIIQRVTSGSTDCPAAPRNARLQGHAVGIVGLGGTMVLQYVAFANAPIVDANIIAYSWPMLAAVHLAVVATGPTTVINLLLAGVSFAGVSMIVLGQGGDGSSTGEPLIGYAAAVGSAVCMAFYTVSMRKVVVPIIDLMLVTTGVGAAVTIAAMVLAGVPVTVTPSAALALYIGAGPVALGYALWSLGMRRSSGRLAPLGFMTPVLSTVLLIASGQTLTGITAIGSVIVLACTVAILCVDRHLGAGRL